MERALDSNGSHHFGLPARIAAGCIALIAWTGLTLQLVSSYQISSSVLLTLWVMFAYFTIWTNFLVAIVFSAVAANRTALRSSWVVAGTTLSILLVGGLYVLLLRGKAELSGDSAIASAILHMATPVVVFLFWIFFAPKGNLTWQHPLRWAVYTFLYLAYELARGATTGQFVYPFLNALLTGWGQVAINSVAIGAAFLLCGYAMVWVDHAAGPRPTRT